MVRMSISLHQNREILMYFHSSSIQQTTLTKTMPFFKICILITKGNLFKRKNTMRMCNRSTHVSPVARTDWSWINMPNLMTFKRIEPFLTHYNLFALSKSEHNCKKFCYYMALWMIFDFFETLLHIYRTVPIIPQNMKCMFIKS